MSLRLNKEALKIYNLLCKISQDELIKISNGINPSPVMEMVARSVKEEDRRYCAMMLERLIRYSKVNPRWRFKKKMNEDEHELKDWIKTIYGYADERVRFGI